jgi:predicted nucleic acid-binding protein
MRSATMRILLDTSFLLPSLGVEVPRAAEALENIGEHELYYSNFSVLECFWVLTSLERKNITIDRDCIQIGLKSIEESYIRAIEDAAVFLDAFQLRRAGHTDIIDCLLYALSLKAGLKFLSFDLELKLFLKDRGFDDTLVIPEV